MSMPEWVQGTVIENIHWTQNLFSLRINAPVDDFKAGQFTSLGLDIEGERTARPYSFLSAPWPTAYRIFLLHRNRRRAVECDGRSRSWR